MALDYISQGAGFMDYIQYNSQDLEALDKILELNNISINQATEYLHQPCSELLFRCRFEFKVVPCDQLFEKSMTYHGSCCSFNVINVTKHLMDATRYLSHLY